MGCGDLVLELRARVEALVAGRVLRLTARDPGARADIPAWCRMTGHALVSAQHPIYLIRRKER
jgi:tRNA 2-thiouridine synthesizing protein A